jgi:hypothetical protein
VFTPSSSQIRPGYEMEVKVTWEVCTLVGGEEGVLGGERLAKGKLHAAELCDSDGGDHDWIVSLDSGSAACKSVVQGVLSSINSLIREWEVAMKSTV